MTATCRTAAVDDTRSLAAALAELVRPDDVVLLVGDLGAGKTAFAQGFAAGLGVSEHVTSPTFTLARSYDGRLRMNHLDVYRLEHVNEAEDLGIAEIVDGGGVTLIEWGDVVLSALPADYLEVRLQIVDDDVRDLMLRTVGPSWSARAAAVAATVEKWRLVG
jgi:tRNA threonylcarbamoyladenosine biosynthesis protein TsaE